VKRVKGIEKNIRKESGRVKNNIEGNIESKDVCIIVNIPKLIERNNESKDVCIVVNITKLIESPLRSDERNRERTIEKLPVSS